jgi:hypothetical protein
MSLILTKNFVQITKSKRQKANIPGVVSYHATYSDGDQPNIEIDITPESDVERDNQRAKHYDETHDDDPHKGKFRMDAMKSKVTRSMVRVDADQ